MSMRETSAEIDAAAADWAVRVDEGSLDSRAKAAFDAWLAGDSRRLGAYARVRAVLAHAGRSKALGTGFDPDGYAGVHGDLAQDPSSDAAPIALRDMPPATPTRRRFLLWGGSAVAAAAVGMVGLSWPTPAQAYRTRKGEVRLVPLEDGSSITLNTASEVLVRFEARERQIELVEGEAFFQVVHDPARPFLVTAGDTRVRAVGTSFSVRRSADRPVEVLVRQGMVEIARDSMPADAVQRVSANTRVVTAAASPIVETPLPPATVGRELAWREGMLAFEDMPLSEAADEFARYSDVRITFADASIGRETVTGLFAANNPRGFARSAALSLGLRARNSPDSVELGRTVR